MRRKVTVLILIIILAVFSLGLTDVAQQLYYKEYPVVNIIVNGTALVPAAGDVPAFQIDGRTMVPIRIVAEALKADVKWDERTRTVIITKTDVAPPAAVEEAKKELIKFTKIDQNATKSRVNGLIENLNKVDVIVEYKFDFYDRNEKYLGHVHGKTSVESQEIKSFEVEMPEEMREFSRHVITIESVTID